MARVIVADEQNIIRFALSSLLQSSDKLDFICAINKYEKLIKKCTTLLPLPDIVIMDLNLGDMDCFETIKRLIRINKKIRILIYSYSNNYLLISKLLQMGVLGFVNKSVTIQELMDSINEVLQYKQYISSDLSQMIALNSLSSHNYSPFTILSSREMQIALMVVQCKKVQHISNQLSLSPKTVNCYRYRIFEKLNIDSDVELTHLALKHNLINPYS